MALKIHKPSDSLYAKALVFAPAGHGKTHLLGTAQEDARTAPMLLLSFEGGEETLAGLDIDVASIRSWDDYNKAYELLSDPDTKYRSVGIDSASETHIWALLQRIAEKGPSRKEPDLIEQGDYGVASTQLRRLLREFRDLPMHVFYTAHSKEIDERGVGKVKIPSMAGQMAEEIVGIMSIVGYLALQPSANEDEETERILILQNYPGFRTKVRSPWKQEVPDEIENPTVTNLLDALHIATVPEIGGREQPATAHTPRPSATNEDPEDGDDGAIDIESLTVKELREELDARSISYADTARKSALVSALREGLDAEPESDDDGN